MRILVLAVLMVASNAYACLFARNTQPQYWYEWASALFAADVTHVAQERDKALDVIAVRVVETFKGPEHAKTATLEIPMRMWKSCQLERPEVGAHVLVALNPNSDTLVVPLTPAYAESLRQQRAR